MPSEPVKKAFVRNRLLAGLSVPDLAAVGRYLEPVALKRRAILQEPKRTVEFVHFIEWGVVSVRIVAAGSMLETTLVGYRGAIGVPYLLGGHIPTSQFVAISPAYALRIRQDHLRDLIGERPGLREHLLRYVEAVALHSAQAGLCGVRHSLQQRLASWLCIACDAFGDDCLPVTHDYFADVLGLRRASVTETLTRFEQHGLIKKSRGLLRVRDRKRLELEACSCYALITDAYTAAEAHASLEQRP
ncbi:hypothetical protein XI03_26950 [Bradyrhizobium sp. CCBAU 65884]|nr:hypothetical protein [Bradyrhizobium sp. CCBAU 65884]